MHPNPAFRQTPIREGLKLARDVGFGMLVVGDTGAPLLSHIPFLLSEDGSEIEFHLVRSNPIARLLREPRVGRLAVIGPHSYISPDWYGIEDQVPTWNYIAVHFAGTMELSPDDTLRDLLDRQTADFERRLLPKPPWTTQKMTPEILERMMRQILPVRMAVQSVDSTFKLNQNKPEDARLAAAEQVSSWEMGARTQQLSQMMRDVGSD